MLDFAIEVLRLQFFILMLENQTLHPDQRSGLSCIRGLRITVYEVLSYLGAGDSIEDIFMPTTTVCLSR